MKYAGFIALVILGEVFEEWLALVVQNHPWQVGIAGGLVLLVAALVVFLYPSGALIVLLGAFGLSWFIGLIDGLDSREKELSYYCKYGAQSRSQLDDCMASVNTDDIRKLDTPAARFAYGEIRECGPGSGPFCPEAAREVATEYGG